MSETVNIRQMSRKNVAKICCRCSNFRRVIYRSIAAFLWVASVAFVHNQRPLLLETTGSSGCVSRLILKNAIFYDQKLWVLDVSKALRRKLERSLPTVDSLDFMTGLENPPACKTFFFRTSTGEMRLYFQLTLHLPLKGQLKGGKYLPGSERALWIEICLGGPSINAAKKIPRAYFFTGRYDSNFWHWTNEIVIPLFATVNRFSLFNGLYKPQDYALVTYGSFHSPTDGAEFSLDLFSKKLLNAFELGSEAWQFEHLELGMVDNVSIYSALPKGFLQSFGVWIRTRSAQRRRNRNEIQTERCSSPCLVYIRRAGRRRLSVDEKITEIATKLGFSVITWQPETTKNDIHHTMDIVHRADVIVGSFGSELTNTIFMREKSQVIMFCPCLNAYMTGVLCENIYFKNIPENLNGKFHSLSEALVRNCSSMPTFQKRRTIYWDEVAYEKLLQRLLTFSSDTLTSRKGTQHVPGVST